MKYATSRVRQPPPDSLHVYRRELVTTWELRERLEIGGEPLAKPIVVRGPQDLLPYLRPWAGLPDEHLIVLALDARMRLIGHAVVSIGCGTSTQAFGRSVARAAVASGAAAVVAVHNHPSGIVEPSFDDVHATVRLAAACTAVEVPLLDHLIIGVAAEGGVFVYASLKERGQMP